MPEEPEAKKEKRRIHNNTDVKKAKPGTKTLVNGEPGLYLIVDYPNTRHPHGLKRWMFRYKKGRPPAHRNRYRPSATCRSR